MVDKGKAVEILDAVTLNRLNTFEVPHSDSFPSGSCRFSPHSRILTKFDGEKLVSWDLQTGGPVGTILSAVAIGDRFVSATYSTDGKTFAAAYRSLRSEALINVYDLLSKTHKGSYHISKGRLLDPIWAHGDRLRFATKNGGRITIWEAAFTFTHPPAEVASFPTPDSTDDVKEFLFLPTPGPRLALTFKDKVSVWDAETSKFLLESGPIPVSDTIAPPPPSRFRGSSFSSGGRFFASMTDLPEAYVWRESPTGYTLHQRLIFTSVPQALQATRTYLSPNGESVIVQLENTIHLWPTTDQITPPSSIQTGKKRNDNYPFILAFSPNETLAAFVRKEGNVVTVLDLQSGGPQVVIDTGMRAGCLGVAESTVIVVGREGKIVTWSLPAGNDTLNSRVTITNNVQTTMLGISQSALISISPDFSRVAITSLAPRSLLTTLGVYDASTGRRLAVTNITKLQRSLRFTPDGRGIWGVSDGDKVEGWEILQNSESDRARLMSLDRAAAPQAFFPWQSHRGYKVTSDGWVLSPTQKRLLWLPHYWRLDRWDMTWSGRYLGLGYLELPEVVILEFPE